MAKATWSSTVVLVAWWSLPACVPLFYEHDVALACCAAVHPPASRAAWPPPPDKRKNRRRAALNSLTHSGRAESRASAHRTVSQPTCWKEWAGATQEEMKRGFRRKLSCLTGNRKSQTPAFCVFRNVSVEASMLFSPRRLKRTMINLLLNDLSDNVLLFRYY